MRLQSLTSALRCAAVLDEKAAAAQALGIYAAETRGAFAPHIKDALATLLAMGNYFHDDVRLPAHVMSPFGWLYWCHC